MSYKISLLLGAAALIAISAPSAAMAGTPAKQDVACKAGSFLVGFQGHIGVWIDQMQPLCAAWNPSAKKLDAPVPGDDFGDIHGGGVDLKTAICAPGSAVRGISWTLATPNGPPGHVQNLSVTCASVSDPSFVDSTHHALGSGGGSGPFSTCNSSGSNLLAKNFSIWLDGINITGLELQCDAPANIIAAAGHVVPFPHPLPLPHPGTPGGTVPFPHPFPHPLPLPGGSATPPPPPPPPVSPSQFVEGTWKTNEGTIVFEQDGGQLLGSYPDGGRLVLHRDEDGDWVGKWSEANANHRCDDARYGTHFWGDAVFTFTDKNRHFEGVWTYCNAKIPTGKMWLGDRVK